MLNIHAVVINIIKRYGLWTFIIYAYRKFVWRSSKYRRLFLFVLDTPRPTPESVLAAKGHTFRFATIDDIEILRSIPEYQIYRLDVLAFQNGDRCLLQLDGEELVGFAWLANSSLVEIGSGFHFNMADDMAYNYKGYTSPLYRGQGFQPLRHLKLLEIIRSSGQGRLFGYVEHLNLSSLKGVKKSGYRKIGTLLCTQDINNIKFSLKVSRNMWSNKRRS